MPASGIPPSPVSQPPREKPFKDATASSGITYTAGHRIPPTGLVKEFATGGVAAGDYDRDGDIDLFITRGDIGPNLLYRNNGQGVFVDVAAAAGLAFTANTSENYRHAGSTFADMDGDGDLDLFIGGTYGDPSFIYANNGDGTFVDVTAGSGIEALDALHNISAAFGDYDLDGDLDMFVAHWGVTRNLDDPGDTEHLWRNDSSGGTIRFASVSIESGIADAILPEPDQVVPLLGNDYTFTPIFARIDGDLYPDLLSVADFRTTRVFMNQTDGSFLDTTDPGVIIDANGMGSAVGDFDNDGDLDWFVSAIFAIETQLPGNRLYRNNGGAFDDVTDIAGVAHGDWGWGACFVDLDDDGDLDIYHTNGWPLRDVRFREDLSRAFLNRGNGTFVSSASKLGLADTKQGRGVVCADFDGDGDIDIFQQHTGPGQAATYWRNDESTRNSLVVRLRGRAPNTEAAGARIFATIGGITQMREVTIGNNFVSQNPAEQHFGLGLASQVDELRIEWPDGEESLLGAVAAGPILTVDQPPAL